MISFERQIFLAWGTLLVFGYAQDVIIEIRSCYKTSDSLVINATYKGSGTVTAVQWYYSRKTIPSDLLVSATSCSQVGTLDPAFPISRMHFACPNTLGTNKFQLTIDGPLENETNTEWGVDFSLQSGNTVSGLQKGRIIECKASGGCSCCPCENCTCECDVAWEGLTAFGVAWSPVEIAVCVIIICVCLHKCGWAPSAITQRKSEQTASPPRSCFKKVLIVSILVTAITAVFDLVVGIAGIVKCKMDCDCGCDCECDSCNADYERVEVVIGLGATCIALAVGGCVFIGIIIKLQQGQTPRTEEQNDDKKQDNDL